MKSAKKAAEKEAAIRETIGKFTTMVISARETFEGEKLTFEEVMQTNNACTAIIRKFAGIEPCDRFFFHYKWDYTNEGRQYGFQYLSHYICALFVELATKRWEPKSKKDMSFVMKLAHSIKKDTGKDLSTAMTKAYTRIERSGRLRTDSIQSECRVISETCALGNWNDILPSYPCLNKSVDGLNDSSRPKAKAVQLCADILGPLCNMIGYK